MRTNSLQRSKGRVMRWLIAAVFLFVIVYMIRVPLAYTLSYVTRPLYAVRVWFTSSPLPFSHYITSKRALIEERNALLAEVAKRTYDAERLLVLEEERAILTQGKNDTITASVVRLPNETPYDVLVVDRGSENGVEEGALVYAHEAAVGIVSRVMPYSALVTLFSTPGISVPLYIHGPNMFVHGYGVGGGVVRIGVPQGITLSVGDRAVVPLMNSPLYGVVEHVVSESSEPEQYGYIVQSPSLATMRFVTIDRVPFPQWSHEAMTDAVTHTRTVLFSTSSPWGVFADMVSTSTHGSTTP